MRVTALPPTGDHIPSVEQLYTHESELEPQLDVIKAETDDDPEVTIFNLEPEERERVRDSVSVSFIVCTQVEGYDKDLSARLQDLDYLIIDSPHDGAKEGRGIHDMARNAGYAGATLMKKLSETSEADSPEDRPIHATEDTPGVDGVIVTPFPDSDDPVIERFVKTPYYRSQKPAPIIRTAGLGLQDRIAEDGPTIKEVRERGIDKVYDDYRRHLFLLDNKGQRKILREYLRLSTPEMLAIDQQLETDISTIVANAIRRHPEAKELRFGVVIDARHERVAEGLSRLGLLGSSGVQYEPFIASEGTSTFLSSPLDRAEREAAENSPHSASLATLNRALLGDYIHETFLDRIGDKRKALWATRTLEAQFSDEEVKVLLEQIDVVKLKKLSRFNPTRKSEEERLKKRVTTLIWKHEKTVALQEKI